MAEWPSLTAMFLDQADRLGDHSFLWAKSGGIYAPISWRETSAQVQSLARALRRLGVEPGDRVMLCAENRPEWLIANLAIMAAGAITVPAYTTNTVADHHHILSDSGAKVAIVSTAKLAERLIPAAQRANDVDVVISMGAPEAASLVRPRVLAWDDVLADGNARSDDVAAWVTERGLDDTAVIIYTSGTGRRTQGRDAVAPRDPPQLPGRRGCVARDRTRRRFVPVLFAALAFL